MICAYCRLFDIRLFPDEGFFGLERGDLGVELLAAFDDLGEEVVVAVKTLGGGEGGGDVVGGVDCLGDSGAVVAIEQVFFEPFGAGAAEFAEQEASECLLIGAFGFGHRCWLRFCRVVVGAMHD